MSKEFYRPVLASSGLDIAGLGHTTPDDVCSIVIVGQWRSIPEGVEPPDLPGTIIRHAPANADMIVRLVAGRHLTWLLAAHADDEVVRVLADSVRRSLPDIKLAVLGPSNDLDRCEHWLRNGAVVYLSSDTPVARLAAVLRAAAKLNVEIIDDCFRQLALNRPEWQGQDSTRKLTEREHDVVRLLRRGMRNADIARQLSVTESTVEFHVRHILAKLGAKNRTEAVVRSILL